MIKKFSFLLFVVLLSGAAWAKAPDTPASQGQGKDPFAVEALNGFPLAIRQATLEVALHANLLQEILKIQKADVAQFKAWLKPLPEKAQREMYQLARFPKLLNELLAAGGTDPKQLESILKNYPREIHDPAQNLLRTQMPLLKQINDLNYSSNEQFEKLIKDYPPQTRQAYHMVLQHPVILEILARHPDYTYLVGHVYGSNYTPSQDRLSKVNPSARKKDQAVSDAQKQALAQSPAEKTIDAAAQKFTQEANAPLDQVEDPSKAVQVTAKYDPYFFNYYGYSPGFYDYAYWYGFPAWGYPFGWW
jgi:hypothetical protein